MVTGWTGYRLKKFPNQVLALFRCRSTFSERVSCVLTCCECRVEWCVCVAGLIEKSQNETRWGMMRRVVLSHDTRRCFLCKSQPHLTTGLGRGDGYT